MLLYDIFSKNWLTGKGSIYIYSDPHFGDDEIYKLRFPTTFQDGTEYMHESLVRCLDEKQIKNINAKVGKNDTLIILGDIGNIECVKKLKAKYKILIMGNHEKGASNYKRVFPYVERYGDYDPITYGEDNHLFDEVYEGPLMINDRVILSHEPIEGLPKYMFNIHGHDHAKKFSSPQHLNVCAENIDYTPLNLISLLKNGLLKDIDSIHRVCIDKATKTKKRKEIKKVNKMIKKMYNKSDI